jgi:hypothetical protein
VTLIFSLALVGVWIGLWRGFGWRSGGKWQQVKADIWSCKRCHELLFEGQFARSMSFQSSKNFSQMEKDCPIGSQHLRHGNLSISWWRVFLQMT